MKAGKGGLTGNMPQPKILDPPQFCCHMPYALAICFKLKVFEQKFCSFSYTIMMEQPIRISIIRVSFVLVSSHRADTSNIVTPRKTVNEANGPSCR
jgi:hypothetical protein